MHCTHGPIQVPLTQLSPLSQTCLSCPNSVPPPHSPLALSFTDTSISQSLAGPPARIPCTLLLYSPGRPPVGFCSLFRACGGVGRGVRHSPSVAGTCWRWCGRRDTARFGLVGVEFGRGSFALLRSTMGPGLLKETRPLTAIIIRRGALNPFE